jgi:hypothetical protein
MNTLSVSPYLRRLFAATKLYTDDRPYALVSLPRHQMRAATILFGGLADPFAAMIVDKDEITIVMHEMDWSLAGRDLDGMRAENGWRLITLDLALNLDTVGYMAAISRTLADANIAIMPIAAYSRDHVFVRARDFDRAWKALSDFIGECRKDEG